MRNPRILLCFVLALPLAAQRDFLTGDEVDQLRLIQEPNERLALYAGFAQQRIILLQQLVSREKPGRSLTIHDLLEQYTSIIDAIDTVADDALKRGIAIDKGISVIIEAEKKMVEELRKIEESRPNDMVRYEFVLQQAIDTTADSLELSAQDLKKRAHEVQVRQKEEEEKRESLMQPKDLEVKRAAEKKEAEQKKKAPTLYRKGEKKKAP